MLISWFGLEHRFANECLDLLERRLAATSLSQLIDGWRILLFANIKCFARVGVVGGSLSSSSQVCISPQLRYFHCGMLNFVFGPVLIF